MSPFYSFLLLLTLLFLLSKQVSQSIGSLIYKITRSKRITVSALAFIFLPGTVIHEFAHAAIAQGLGIYVGEIEFTPKFETEGIKLGSVQIAESDPFRRFLIGIAPLIIGFVLIFLTLAIYDRFQISGIWTQVLLFYLLFEIGNTMFSSKRDMEGALELLLALILFLAFAYFAGFKQIFFQVSPIIKRLEPFFKMANSPILKIIIIDLISVLTARILTPTWRIDK